MSASRLIPVLSLAAAAAVGCSLTNSFDEVPEISAGVNGGSSGSSAGGSAGSGATSAGGSSSGAAGTTTGGTAGEGGTAGQGGGGQGGTAGTGAAGGSAGAAGTGGSGGSALEGLIVVGDKTNEKLLALDPGTGELLQERDNNVQGVAYDAKQDVWFVWEQGTSAITPAKLRALKFNAVTRDWEMALGEVDVPAVFSNFISVLNGRILYESVQQGMSGPEIGYTLLDTSNPESIGVLGTSQTTIALDGLPRALLSRPNSGNTIGGTVNFLTLEGAPCDPDPDGGAATRQCVRLEAVFVQAGAMAPVTGTKRDIGEIALDLTSGVSVTAGSAPNSEAVAFPPDNCSGDPITCTTKGFVQQYTPTGFSPAGSALEYDVNAPGLADMAVDTCREIGLILERDDDRSIHAVPLNGDDPIRQNLAEAGGLLVYEPYTQTVLRAFTGITGNGINAFRLSGTTDALAFGARSQGSMLPWNPPEMVPSIVKVKTPNGACP